MTIHTFETTTTISGSQWRSIQSDICISNKWKTDHKGLTTYWGLRDKGILIHCRMSTNAHKKGYFLKYIISGKRALETDNYVDLIDSSEYKALKEAVNKALDRVSPSLPHLGKCKLSRMDFCINFTLGSSDQVDAYLSTLKRARLPKCMKRVEFMDEKAHRRTPGKHEFTFSHKSDDNLTISFYDKARQIELQEENGYWYPNGTTDKADSILRMEFRCKIKKLIELKGKYSSYDIGDFFKHADEISDFLFHNYLPQLFGKGKVLTFEKASKIVSKSDLDEKDKDRCTELLSLVTRCRSAEKGIREYQSKHPAASIPHIEQLLSDLDISYVTIARETAKELPDETFITPLDLFESYQRSYKK